MYKDSTLLPRPHRAAAALVLAVVGLASWNWYLDPAAAATWMKAMVVLPALWAAMVLYSWWALRVRAPRPDDEAVLRYSEAASRFFAVLIAIAALAETASLAFDAAGALQLIEGPETKTHVLGLLSGAIVVVLGNGLPKIVTPVSLLPEGGATRISRMRRFIGRSWVLVGLVIVVMFAFAPLDVAQSARRWMLAAAAASMVGGILWLNLWPERRAA